jgi:hypothetical protein
MSHIIDLILQYVLVEPSNNRQEAALFRKSMIMGRSLKFHLYFFKVLGRSLFEDHLVGVAILKEVAFIF